MTNRPPCMSRATFYNHTASFFYKHHTPLNGELVPWRGVWVVAGKRTATTTVGHVLARLCIRPRRAWVHPLYTPITRCHFPCQITRFTRIINWRHESFPFSSPGGGRIGVLHVFWACFMSRLHTQLTNRLRYLRTYR